MKPERWPAGAPQRIVAGTSDELWPIYGIDEDGNHHSDWAFTDIDAAPTKSYIIENRKDENVKPFFNMAHDKRPEFDLMQKDAVRRKFDMVLAWSVDRLGRSVQDLIAFLNELLPEAFRWAKLLSIPISLSLSCIS